MKTLYSCFLLFLVSQLSACASLVATGVGSGGYASSQHDRTITTRVERHLSAAAWLNASRISVNTYRGTVTLNGSVDSRASEQRVVALARSVQGVKRVISRLAIRSSRDL